MTAIARLSQKPWIWSWFAAFVVWFATIVVTGGASTFGLSQAALTFAAFSIIVGIGQMFVITLGPGNIDLSVPATMTLAGTVALKLMDVDNAMIVPGLLVAVVIGIAVGIGNYALIKALRIPPNIATLSMSLRPTRAYSGVVSPSHRLESPGVSSGTGINHRRKPRWRAYSCMISA